MGDIDQQLPDPAHDPYAWVTDKLFDMGLNAVLNELEQNGELVSLLLGHPAINTRLHEAMNDEVLEFLTEWKADRDHEEKQNSWEDSDG